MNAVSPRSSAELQLAYLPIFLDVRGRIVLLIGCGNGAQAKLNLLLQAGARVRLVAPHPFAGCAGGDIEPEFGPLEARHFTGAALAVDASGDPDTNRLARAFADTAGIPLNVVDRSAFCDFVFPAILDRSPVIIAVSTGALAPAIARLIRQRLEIAIPAGIGRLAILAGRLRASVAARLSAAGRSALFWERIFDGEAGRLALAGQLDDAAILAEALIAELEVPTSTDEIVTLEIASDDPGLLTLRAAQLLRMADVILHDPSIGVDVLALGRRDARRVVLDAPDALRAALERIAQGDRAVHVRMRR